MIEEIKKISNDKPFYRNQGEANKIYRNVMEENRRLIY